MANILLKYLEERYKYDIPQTKAPGPVITISRDFGCPANICADTLTDLLTEQGEEMVEPWRVISKEILDKAAKELGLTSEKIEFVFKFEKRSAIDEILEALSSKYYKSERKIKNTIRDVIRSIGEQGRAIIIGRAGSVILRDIPNSLHVRLIAPLDYRVNVVSKNHEISHSEAKKLTLEMDKKRTQLRNDFAGKRMNDVDYDLILNCKTLNTQKIAQIISETAKMLNLI